MADSVNELEFLISGRKQFANNDDNRDDSQRFIYIIKCENFVKIGVTWDIQKRLAELQSANPFNLELIAFIKGNHSKEKQIHSRFSRFRVRGEWFRYTEDVKNECKMIFDM